MHGLRACSASRVDHDETASTGSVPSAAPRDGSAPQPIKVEMSPSGPRPAAICRAVCPRNSLPGAGMSTVAPCSMRVMRVSICRPSHARCRAWRGRSVGKGG